MKLWMKVAIFGSILLVCYYAWQLKKADEVKYTAKPEFTAAIELPKPLIRKEIKREELLINLPEQEQPFRQLFFETMVLKGIMKDSFGRWLAIFTDGKPENASRLLKFAAGDTHDSITLVDVDQRGCVVKYGTIERRFDAR